MRVDFVLDALEQALYAWQPARMSQQSSARAKRPGPCRVGTGRQRPGL